MRADKDKYVRLNPGYFQWSSEKIKHVWKWSGETESDHSIRRERTAAPCRCASDCERLQGSGGGADTRSGSSLPCSTGASHTSPRLGTLLLLINKSWRMRGAHIVLTAVRGAFSITHYYHIHIHFHWHASFPSAQIKPKRMQKGREGRDERGGSWWWNAGLGHSSLHSNLHANGLVWEQGLYHEEWTGAEAEKQL